MTEHIRPFEDLRTTGLLWLLNKAALHPRGYALAFNYDDGGDLVGWSLLGDGTEPWQFDSDTDDRCFSDVEELLAWQSVKICDRCGFPVVPSTGRCPLMDTNECEGPA